jgi:hypothetical protein
VKLQRLGAPSLRQRASGINRDSTRQHGAGDDQNIQGIFKAQTISSLGANRPFDK